MPFAVSGPVLYYNKLAFQKAGLNPDQPPSTLPELVADAKALKQHGLGGMGLKTRPLAVRNVAGYGQPALGQQQQRPDGAGPPRSYSTARPASRIFTELDQMVTSGDAATNSALGADQYDNLLGVGSGKYSMTIDTSAALGTIQQLLSTGRIRTSQLGVGAFPKYAANADGGVRARRKRACGSPRGRPPPSRLRHGSMSHSSTRPPRSRPGLSGPATYPLRTSAAQSSLIQNLLGEEPWVQGRLHPVGRRPALLRHRRRRARALRRCAHRRRQCRSLDVRERRVANRCRRQCCEYSDQLIQTYNQRLGVG